MTATIVQDAIARSISHDEIVHLAVAADELAAVLDELLIESDDSADHPHGEHEFWGTAGSHEWRVHVREES